MIHETAVIDKGAELGTNVEVGPFTCIMDGAVIGDGCTIGPQATIFGSVTMGSGCEVHAGAVLGDTPQDVGFKNTSSSVAIGNDCVIREGVTIHRGTEEGSETVVGDECFLMAFSHLAHNVVLANNVILANGALLAGYVEVGERAFVSGNVGVHQFVKIGRLAMLGGGAVATKDVPPFCMLKNAEHNTVIGLNVVGMRRSGMSFEERKAVQRAFKVLFLSGFNASQAKDRLEELFPEGPASEFAAFITASTRGLCACAIQRNSALDV
ncbi:MAG: acyl-ACP--UDP-N-acetylglucosamine O-acyltransferase [Kiritimatiellia bacterium]|jgi:UDP-N-acetylglucosamine acyltransferase|nr:acyl-ACP--UDP-N-acetylglucosamine O-acyltransferase [Kiritimatiellia bacterium]MDP6629503.1 acyl-ACP--UDP-N-acetylglucosamine O-acyltransferase [Kiritimatiellia bacterium]MDP6809210.1 acyl-ACP--UDP-N-acetylglucosamine O-acyltransferase [Kiritimatiellia bacterium]MDP7022949.1 acyl-ACP--UDP-N-acetylglucosamine O-acyltransferase [Kiritimatiellia bacterium]